MKYQSGNTIRCEVEFTDFAGQYTDPTVVKFITYDQTYTKLNEVILTSGNKTSVGKWFYDYTLPSITTSSKSGTIYYEWMGEINGKPSVKRDALVISFV